MARLVHEHASMPRSCSGHATLSGHCWQ
jgi:hypothetical protein